MKKMYILALAAAAMAFSCNKNVVEQAPQQKQEPVVRTFTCTIAEPDTKLAINDANGKTSWEVGDEILIHGEYTQGAYCTTVTLGSENISADGKKATFTIGDITTYNRSGYKSNLYAQYPADAVVLNNHCYWNNRYNKSNAPLMVGYNDGDSFVMHNLCGILSFVVSGEDFDSFVLTGNNEETVAYSALQSRIRLTDSDTENTDGFPIRASGDDFTSDPLTSLTVDFIDGENRIFIPGGVNFTGGFTIKFLKSGSIVKTLSTTAAVNIPRNSYRPMGDVTAYLKTYVPPATHNSSIEMTGATALDATDNANCYIVDGSVAANAEKVFTFKAYKGNSATGVGSVASAAIVWETWNDASTVTANSVIAAVDFDKQEANDYYTMVFKMPETLHAGNALIAAKDAGDNILWSWHIWVPETSVSNVDAGFAAENAIMDRNLGAIIVMPTDGANVKALGMYYQWGRKDPLCGTRIKGVPSEALKVSVSGQAADYATSIKNPTVFYYVESSNWLSENITTLWDKGDGKKTEYDPCPPGYKVPVFNSTYPMWNMAGATFGTNWTWDSDNAYAKYNSATAAFPLGGYLNGTGQGESGFGSRAEVWSATAASSSRGNGMLLREGAYNAINPYKSQGGNVRCVAE